MKVVTNKVCQSIYISGGVVWDWEGLDFLLQQSRKDAGSAGRLVNNGSRGG